MKIFYKLLLTALTTIWTAATVCADTLTVQPDKMVVTFRFVPGKDMFYVPWRGNGIQLEKLYSLVDEYNIDIHSGKMRIHIDGFCTSLANRAENMKTATARSNRVKSEIIVHKGLKEDHFVTKNHVTGYTSPEGKFYRDMVIVTVLLPVPAYETGEAEHRCEIEAQALRERQENDRAEAERLRQQAEITERERAPQQEEPPTAKSEFSGKEYSRWSMGLNVGLPFFWGDFTSISHDKPYIGISVGIQGTFQINPLFGITLSLDWARNKAGSRGYAADYLLDEDGMTWYTPHPVVMQPYKELYSKINMFSTGLHLDVNINRLFGPRIADGKLKLIFSPAVYAQRFSSKVFTKSNDAVYVDKCLSKDMSFGLGGDAILRYCVNPAIDVQLKGTGIWITDNGFDNIRTVGYVKQNAMWQISAGLVWKICGNRKPNLMDKTKKSH